MLVANLMLGIWACHCTHLRGLFAQCRELAERLAAREIELVLTEAALDHLARAGYEPAYGARPLKRAIRREVETPLARRLVVGEFPAGSRVLVDASSDSLTFTGAVAEAA